MQVDFNNLRKQALYSYHRLCTLLNNHIHDKSHDPVITINPDTIQEEMDLLRSQLWTLACCFQENDPDVKDISDEVGDIAIFNPQTTSS